MEYLNSVDINITNLLNSLLPHNFYLDYFFSFLSLIGNSVFLWLILITVSIFLEERKNPGIQKRDIRFVILFLICFSISFISSSLILKNIIRRPRPVSLNFNEFQQISASCPKSYSFPSTHATTAFAAATVLTFFDKKRRWIYYLFALLIALSRVYLGCHYFIDILGGGILGFGISRITLILFPNRSK